MGHGDNCINHDLPHPCDLCRIESLEKSQLTDVDGEIFYQITHLMERCKQLELINGTQFLLIGNLEKNVRKMKGMKNNITALEKKVRELIVRDATKTDQFAILDEHLGVLNTLIRDQQNSIKELVTHTNEEGLP